MTQRHSPTLRSDSAPPQSLRRRAKWIAVGVLAVVALLVVGVVIVAFVTSETLTETHSFPAADVDVLEVAVAAGDLDIVVESRDDVEVTTHVTSNVWSRAASRVALSDGRLSIVGDCERSWLVVGCSTRHQVALPRAATTEARIRATTGTIEIMNYAGNLQVMTDTGRIQLLSFLGRTAALSTTAGAIVVQAETPPEHLTATATAGTINILVPDDIYRVETSTTTGDVDVSVRRDPAADRRISATTTAGAIRISTR